MGRPKLTIRSIYRNIAIPEDLAARMDLELYSEVEGKIPFGAQQEFFVKLMRKHFDEQDRLRRKQIKSTEKLTAISPSEMTGGV